MQRRVLKFCAAFALICAGACAAAAPYQALTRDCDGFPQLPIATLDGMCLGLVAQKGERWPAKMPRTLIELADGKLLVADMGGWAPNKGKLWLIDPSATSATASALLNGLNLPHKLLPGPSGKFYLGEAHRIRRFSWVDGKVSGLETVVDSLPDRTGYLHPLKNFAFNAHGDLLINIGSTSDRCEKASLAAECTNGVEASIRQYDYVATTDSWSKKFQVLGRGLRNSMALVVHASGTVLQAENSIDLADADAPYEEINVIAGDAFYGWPKCYNRDVALDGNRCLMVDYQQPWTLLPPHVAPLDAIYYRHDKLPALDRHLLMSWHGYRVTGSRVVAYPIDVKGRPLLQQQANFRRAPQTPTAAYTEHPFAPTGTLGDVAQHLEVVSQWHSIPGLRPEGAPVGLTQARDGSVFIVDDRNGSILRLSTGTSYQPDSIDRAGASNKLPMSSATVTPRPVLQILKQHCAGCHAELKDHPELLLTPEKWLLPSDGIALIEQKLFFDKVRPMPPQPTLSELETQVLRHWLKK